MKPIFLIFLTFFVSSFFFSCSKKKADVLKYMMWGQPEEVKAVQGFLKQFHKKNPDTKVELIHAPDSDYYVKLQILIAGNEPPDIMYMDSNAYPGYIEKGALFDMTDYIKNDPDSTSSPFNLKDYFSQAEKPFLYNGRYYGLSKDFTSFVLYYNKDLFDAAGLQYPNKNWTWQDFRKAAIALTKDKNSDKIIDQFGFVFETWLGYWISWIRQNGGKIYDSSRGQYVIGVEPFLEKNVETLQFLYDLMYKDHCVPTIQEANDMKGAQLFETGRVAMATYGRWRTLELKNVPFNWDIAELPHKKQKVSTLFTVAYSISKTSKQKLKAWKLIKFLLGPQGQIATAESCLAIPSLRSVAFSEHFLKPKALPRRIDVGAFFRSLKYSEPLPANSNVQLFNDTINRYLENIFLKKKDIRKTLILLQEELEKLEKTEKARSI